LDQGQLFLYADDTALLFEGGSWEEVYDAAGRGLLRIKRWFDQNRLTVNVKKTKYMAVSLRADGDPINFDLKLHTCGGQNDCVSCESVERVINYKYLGITFDNRLKWSDHINEVRMKLRKFIFIFRVLRSILNIDTLRLVYYAYVQSVLSYGILAWGGALPTCLKPIHTIQKTIIKAALHKPIRSPTDLLFEEFKVFNITQLFVRTLLIYIFKNNFEIFSSISHGRFTRSTINSGIVVPRLNKSINKTSSFYIAHILFRNLPDYIKLPPQCSIATFKLLINRWLIETGRVALERLLVSPYV
jgi:hypothetical protein